MKNSCPQSCPLFLSVPYRARSLPLDSFEINLMDVVRICQTQESEGRKSPADKRIGGDRRQTQGHPFKHFQTSNAKAPAAWAGALVIVEMGLLFAVEIRRGSPYLRRPPSLPAARQPWR